MSTDGILITIDANTATFDRALANSQRSLLRYSSQLKLAQKAQAEYDAAVAASGASSTEATAAQERLGAALARTTIAEQNAAIEAKRAGEIQAAASAKVAAAAEAASVKQAAALRRVGTVAGAIGGLAALGLGEAAKAAADFNAKMAQVGTLSRASAGQVQALSKAAGGYANIGISASSAADAEIELVKAGVSVKDILGGGLRGTLELAAAGQTDVATATEIASAAMVQFGLAGRNIPHIADLLSAGANKSLGSVQDLGEGLKAVGTTAHQAGLSINETVGTLAEFAAAGLTGSLGGTAFKQMLLKLEAPSAKAAATMKDLGVSLYDANGHAVTMTALAGQLHDKLGSLSDAQRNAALATIFGSRAVQAANILFQNGAGITEKWTKKVNDAGNAARTTQGQMNSLSGDMKKLGAQFENDAISIGQQLQPALRSVTHGLTDVAKVVGDLPDPIKAIGANFAVTIAALGLGVFAFSRLRNGAISLAEALGILAKTQATVGRSAVVMAGEEDLAAGATSGAARVGLLGRLNKGAAGGLGLLLGGQIVSQYAPPSRASTIGGDTLSGAGAGAVIGSVVPVIETGVGALVGAGIGAVIGARSSDSAEVSNFNALIAHLQQQQARVADRGIPAATANSRAMMGGASSMSQTTGAAIAQADAFQRLLGSVKATEAGYDGLSAKERRLDATFANSLGSIANLTLTIAQARASDKDLGDVMNKTGTHIDAQSVAGATLIQSMKGIADSALSVTGNQARQAAAVDQARKAIISQTEAAGASKPVAEALAASLLSVTDAANSIPSGKSIHLTVNDYQARTELARVAQSLDAIHSKTINIGVTHTGVQAGLGIATGGLIRNGTVQRFSGGGYASQIRGLVRGPGTGTSDSILARVSNGEFVTRAAVVAQQGAGRFAALNAGRATIVPKSVPQFANGGGYMAGSWGRGTSDPALVAAVRDVGARVSAVETVLTNGKTRATVDNGAEIGGNVRATVQAGIKGYDSDKTRFGKAK